MRFSRSVFAVLVLLLIFFKGILPNLELITSHSYPAKTMPMADTVPQTHIAQPKTTEVQAYDIDGNKIQTSTISVSGPAAGEVQVYAIDTDKINEIIKPFMMILITIVFTSAGLYIILSRKFDESSKKWAFATVGTIIGFWLG